MRLNMYKSFFYSFYVLWGFLGSAQLLATSSALPASFPTSEITDLKKTLEDHLNSFTTFKADFTQEDDMGQISSGTFYLSRPGKLRFDYEKPEPTFMLADGKWLILYEPKLEEASYIDLESTPAHFLLKDVIKLDDEMVLQSVREEDAQVEIGLLKPEENFYITLTFSKNPLCLIGWTSRDSQGNYTKVHLQTPEINPSIDPKKFVYHQSNRNRR
jgi:outer membrane lipoprotein-sorting protein